MGKGAQRGGAKRTPSKGHGRKYRNPKKGPKGTNTEGIEAQRAFLRSKGRLD